ncbi:hypothetical protein D3C87_1638970 [compost metagenome]
MIDRFETITQAMVMTDRPTPNIRKAFLVTLAIITGFVAAQTIVLEDGSEFFCEMARPNRAYFVASTDEDGVRLISVHRSVEEAQARMEAEEACVSKMVQRSESGGRLQ